MANITGKNKTPLINYLSEVAADKEFNLHILEWNNSILLRNCTETGNLIDLKLSNQKQKPWVQLTVNPFYFNNAVFPIFACHLCNSNILSLDPKQDKSQFDKILCHHSKVARC